MEAHAHGDRAPASACCPAGRCDRARRGREGDEERIPLGVDLDSAVVGERRPEHAAVLGERLGVRGRAESAEQARRALDVREQERHRPARQLGAHHDSIPVAPLRVVRRRRSRRGRASPAAEISEPLEA